MKKSNLKLALKILLGFSGFGIVVLAIFKGRILSEDSEFKIIGILFSIIFAAANTFSLLDGIIWDTDEHGPFDGISRSAHPFGFWTRIIFVYLMSLAILIYVTFFI